MPVESEPKHPILLADGVLDAHSEFQHQQKLCSSVAFQARSESLTLLRFTFAPLRLCVRFFFRLLFPAQLR